jgi:hypothetical protein
VKPVTKPLEGVIVGLSISEGEDLGTYALTSADVNRVTVEVCRRLIGLGAQMVLGHKWAPGGIMQAIARFAQAYQAPTPTPIIHNHLGWPDRASLSAAERSSLKALVNIVEAPDDPRWHRTEGRSEALTQMRQNMTDLNHARLFLSGLWAPKKGRRIAGVVEEAVMTIEAGKAIYLSNMMGGATATVIRMIRGGAPPVVPADRNSPTHEDHVRRLRGHSLARLASQSGLSVDDMNALFDAQNLDTVVQLATRGMRTLVEEGRLQPPIRKSKKKR